MKTIPSLLKAAFLILLSVPLASVSYGDVPESSTASTAAISLDRTQYFSQVSASAPAAQAMPFSLNFNIRGGSLDMSAWGPAFYKPGSGSVAQTGSSTATNTGTLNFSAAPNNGGHDYLFVHDFATNADLLAAYPLGAYGVNFQGTGAPTPNTFTAGLAFATSGTTYASVTPQIASVNNGATWSSGILTIGASGVTTLNLNTFPEYHSTPFGSYVGAGIYEASTGNVIAPASVETYYLPTLGVDQPPATQVTLDGSWLTPGKTYTLEIQYVVFASAPEEGFPNGINFQGVSSYVKNTSINVQVAGATAPSSDPDWRICGSADFDHNGTADIVRQNISTGARELWLMNGPTVTSTVSLGADPDINWRVVGTGDFNGDGNPDIVWQNLSTGARTLWLMNGTAFGSAVSLGTDPDVNWRIVGIADFDHNTTPDIFWQNIVTGARCVWLMNGTAFSRVVGFGSDPDVNWRVSGFGDFNGNGTPDVVWQNITTGARALWLMNGASFVSAAGLGTDPDVNWRVMGAADFNGDGTPDLMWENITTGKCVLWLMNGTSYSSVVNLN